MSPRAKITEQGRLVLEVLEGQSPDYLAAPFCAAFAAEGLAGDDVELELAALGEAGLVELVEVRQEGFEYELDDDGGIIVDEDGPRRTPVETVVDRGWRITTAGRRAID